MSLNYTKAKTWKGQDLKGSWLISYKIDGVRALLNDEGQIVSRANKPLYNLDHLRHIIRDHEVFINDWSNSVSACRTKDGVPVPASCVYDLRADTFDSRLVVGTYDSPTAAVVNSIFLEATKRGFEGLVLRSSKGVWLRVKPVETHDVFVTGVQEGTGRNKGKLGALLTNYGKVGTGFSDAQRQAYWELKDKVIGKLIEVESMGFTKANKFRHPRFIRLRFDKDTESIIK